MFLERSLAENNELYKQIIPYLVYQYKNSFFLMQRGSKGGEQRLHNCYTLGIGGHVRESDLQDSQSILDWARREFLEEVIFTGNYKPVFLGLLNDDSNAVGRVHLGLVFLLRGDSKHIAIRNQEHRSGKLVSLDQLLAFKDELESWSQIVLDHLNFLLGYKEKPARAQL
jgi:predicted NUDIX family phosphoesterase